MGNKDNTVWIIVGIVAALLLGGIMGSCSGGLIGYGLGQRFSTRSLPTVFPEIQVPPARSEAAPILVTQVIAGSPADKAGIQVGDLISAVDGIELTKNNTIDTLLQKYQPGDLVKATVHRGSSQMDIAIQLEANPELADRVWLGIYYRQQ